LKISFDSLLLSLVIILLTNPLFAVCRGIQLKEPRQNREQAGKYKDKSLLQ
jgi:hypothetical protein